MECGSRKARVTAMFLSELILDVNSEAQDMEFSEAKLRCQKLEREVWVRDKNLRVVSVDQEGIMGRERREEKRAQVDPGIPG